MNYADNTLVVGKTYSYDGWVFVIVRERDEFCFDVLCLTDWGWRYRAGEVTELRNNSAVGQYCREFP